MLCVNPRVWAAYEVKDKNGNTETVDLFTPVSICCSVIAADGDNSRSLRLKILNEDGEVVFIDIPASASVKGGGRDMCALLRDQGVLMTDPGMKLLVDMIRETQPPNALKQYSRPGWHGSVFVAPNGDSVNSNYPVELVERVRQKSIGKSGDLGGWVESVAHAFPHFHFSLALCLGFVGPLIDLLKADSIIVYFSGETSRGKSTSQRLGASIWGSVRIGEAQWTSAKVTPNSAELELARASGSYLGLDDGVHLDGQQTKELIYMTSSGKGKARMSQHGDAKKQQTWNTLITLSDEMSAVQKFNRDKVTVPGGLTVRVADVGFDDAETLPEDRLKQIEKAFGNTGHAGVAFVRQLVAMGYLDDPGRLQSEIDAIAAQLCGETGNSQLLRAAKIPAMVKKAGLIAQAAGLFPSNADIDGIANELWERHRSSELAPVSNSERALEQLRESIVSRKGVDIVNAGTQGYRQAVGWILPDFEDGKDVYAILTSEAPKLAGDILQGKSLGKALKDKNWLVPGGKGNSRSYVPKVGHVNCYLIWASMIDDE